MELILTTFIASQRNLFNTYKSTVRVANLIPDIIQEYDSPINVAKAVLGSSTMLPRRSNY